MRESVYCAVDNDGQIKWMYGSSTKTMYFRTTKYLRGAVANHNKYHKNDPYHIIEFELRPVRTVPVEENNE